MAAGLDAQSALKAAVIAPSLAALRRGKEHGTMQIELRAALRSRVDVAVLPVVRVGGKQIGLSVAELESAYGRRRVHMEGRRALLRWAVCRRHSGQPTATPKRGVSVWIGLGTDGGLVPEAESVVLPPTVVQGLTSAVRNSGLSMFILSYNNVQNLPSGIARVDAAMYMPRETCAEMLPRVPVQLLADLLRARALFTGVAGDA